MQNVLRTWSALSLGRRIVLVAATLGMIASVLLLSRLATAPRMALLYSGLESSAAGDVVAALEQQGVAYEVRGGSIMVDASRRDELRLTLASEGLPANGAVGYELLDGLSGFGTTSQMFDAAYWRAKEGELARTIMSSPAVRSARVHLSVPSSQVFRQSAPPTASIFVTPTNGALGEEQARALRFLVASAVSGLQPDAVSVIDGMTGVTLTPEGQQPAAVGDAKRADALRQSVQRLLEARVGPGNAVVEVSLESETERESIVERRVDPESRVAISSETQEVSATSRGQNGGAVTVASNLPDGEAQGGGESSSQNSESREIVNFEVSETQREILREPGAIRRLTVAVMVDGTRRIDDSGAEVFEPRSEEELNDLRDLVASAVGLDEARGDEITIKSLEFEPVSFDGTEAASAAVGGLDMTALAQALILGAVALALGLFVVRPALTARAGNATPALPPSGAGSVGLPAPVADEEVPGPALDGEIDLGDFPGPQMNVVGDFDLGDGVPGLPDLSRSGGADDPVARLKQLIAERQDETLEVLRSWMETEREKT